ncbi:RNA polymerase sigma factor [Ideonella sp.]|uniref:RNA polymerase sigma factor n=1 Tax=Ideonella sp. TaxID=1929293 RepID=UPI0035B23CAE
MLPFVPWTIRPRPAAPPAGLAWLDAVYRQESDAVYRYALALCGDAALAADATQEAFVALAHAPEAFDPSRGSLGAYLAGIARHALLAAWRLRDRHVLLDDAADDVADDDDEAPPRRVGEVAADGEATLIGEQRLEALWAAVRALPWPFREALVLVDLQERPYAEAAQIAGIELNTLRTRVHRARQRLALALRPATRSEP